MKIAYIEIEFHISLFALFIIEVKEEYLDFLDNFFFSNFPDIEITKERYLYSSSHNHYEYKVIIRNGNLEDLEKILEFVKGINDTKK